MKQNETAEDKLLVNRLIKDNRAAFEQLFRKYHEQVYYFALRYMKTKEDAEEVVQEIFIRIWENRKSIDPAQSFGNYLFTICRNFMFNQNRKKINEQAYIEYVKNYLLQINFKTEDDIVFSDLLQWLNKQIEMLPPQQKQIYRLSRNENMTHKQIADKMHISVKTVETHIRLALKTIRKSLDHELVCLFLLLAIGVQ